MADWLDPERNFLALLDIGVPVFSYGVIFIEGAKMEDAVYKSDASIVLLRKLKHHAVVWKSTTKDGICIIHLQVATD